MPHQIHNDSFFLHGLANSINEFNTAKWIIHPASAFGLYPLSYPSGVPYLLSSISQATNLEIEFIILILSIMISLLGGFLAFITCGEFTDNFIAKFFSALTFIIAPRFLYFTEWTILGRTLFIVLFLLLLWFLIKIIKDGWKIKYIALCFIVILSISTIHHYFLLLPIVISAFFVSILFHKLFKKLENKKNNLLIISLLLFILLIFSLYIQFTAFVSYKPDEEIFKRYLLSGGEFYIILLNIGFFYTLTLGSLIVFSVIYIANILISKKIAEKLFIYFMLIAFIPFSMDMVYLVLFMLPIFSILAGVGINEVFIQLKKRKYMIMPILIAVVLLSINFSYDIVYFQKRTYQNESYGFYPFIDEQSYNAGIFMKEYFKEGEIARYNDRYKGRNIWAVANIIPEKFTGPELIIYDYVNNTDLKIRELTIEEIYGEYKPYLWELKNKDEIYKKVIYSVIVVNEKYPDKQGGSGRIDEIKFSDFYNNITKTHYKVYSNSLLSVWI